MTPLTPITLNKPSTLTSVHDNPPEPASRPLQFTTQGQCSNREVMTAIMEALADQRSSASCIATIYKNAFLHNYQAQLNQLIRTVEAQNGSGTVLITEQVSRLLADDQISLIQEHDGTVQLGSIGRIGDTGTDLERHTMIHSACKGLFRPGLISLIRSYDFQIEIGGKTEEQIIAIFNSDNPVEKSALIAAASHQHNIFWFNEIWRRLRTAEDVVINLTHVNLSKLNLAGIDFRNADFSDANLQNCCLKKAQLVSTNLTNANLNNTDLGEADLSFARLDNTRLIGSNLSGATLGSATGKGPCLLCANLHGIGIEGALAIRHFSGAAFNFSYIDSEIIDMDLTEHFPKADAPVKAIIFPRPSERIEASTRTPQNPRSMPVYMDETEKELLAAKGISFHDNNDGTVQLRRALRMTQDPLRRASIDSALETIFPKDLTKLINSYDQEIEFSEQNETAIMEVMRSTDQRAKSELIAAASRQLKIEYLNAILNKCVRKLGHINLANIDLSNLNLARITLHNVNLCNAVMHGCNLYGARLSHVVLIDANLNGASLDSARFEKVNMDGARLIRANLPHVDFINVNLRGAILKFAYLENARLISSDLNYAYLDHATLRKTNLKFVSFNNASLSCADLSNSTQDQTNFSFANMTSANLNHARLSGADLFHANLTGANFQYVKLTGNLIVTETIWTDIQASHISADRSAKSQLPFHIWRHCEW